MTLEKSDLAGLMSTQLWQLTLVILLVGGIAYFALFKIHGKPAGLILWTLFGMGNQLLAGLGLLAVSVYLVKRGRPGIYTLLPMVFVLVVTLTAMVISIGGFYANHEWVLLFVSCAIMTIALWLIAEAVLSYRTFISRGGKPIRPAPAKD